MIRNEVQKLPLGTSNFEELRKANQIYIDKTDIIFDLASKRGKYLLVRPQGFGKSLLISTFEDLFKNGLRDFKNLKIEKLWKERQTYNVIKLDFSLASFFKTLEEFKTKFRMLIGNSFKKVGFQYSTFDESFYIHLALFLHNLETNSIVLLIDEYDTPLTTCLNSPSLFEDIRNEMANFYTVIKSADAPLRFLFITGVTKFLKVSIFSSLNNLVDLTLTKDSATLLGFTEEEIRKYFCQYIENASKLLKIERSHLIEMMVTNYDGFRFSGETNAHVFTPWSVLNFLNKPEGGFLNYWIESGGEPQVLRKYLKTKVLRNPNDYFKPKRVSINSLRATSGDIEHIDDVVLLTQAGYLTIKSVGSFTFEVGYPNREVAESLGVIYREHLWSDKEMDELGSPKISLCLQHGNTKEFVSTLNKFFLALDYQKYPVHNEIACRNYTQLILIDRPNIIVYAETHNALGRSDLEIRTQFFHWILELKFISAENEAESLVIKKLNEAKEQIQERHYGESDISNRNLIRLALVFSEKHRKFVAWEQITNYS